MNPTKPFIAYCDCIIEYDGRAKSTTKRGTRLIVHKKDGTLLIHRATKITPLNYNGPKSTNMINGNILTSTSKNGEKISVSIFDIKFYHELPEWSSDSISLTGSEKEICDELENNIEQYINCDIKYVERELLTNVGHIDVAAIDIHNIYHIIEAKRTKATISAIYQLHRYVEDMERNNITCKGYLAAPTMTENARTQLERLGYKHIKINPIKNSI